MERRSGGTSEFCPMGQNEGWEACDDEDAIAGRALELAERL